MRLRADWAPPGREVFARIAERYLDGLDVDPVTDRINAVFDAVGGTDQGNHDAAEYARDTPVAGNDEW